VTVLYSTNSQASIPSIDIFISIH